jgi:hypothetical protein
MHDVAAINAVPVCHQPILSNPVVNEQYIDVTSCYRKRAASPKRLNENVQAGRS